MSTTLNLLGLPPEIRDHIYQFTLIDDDKLRFHANGGDKASALEPALTRVNKQTRTESLPIFYRGNTFVLYPRMSAFLSLCNRKPSTATMTRCFSHWLRSARARLGLIRAIDFPGAVFIRNYAWKLIQCFNIRMRIHDAGKIMQRNDKTMMVFWNKASINDADKPFELLISRAVSYDYEMTPAIQAAEDAFTFFVKAFDFRGKKVVLTLEKR